MKLRSLLVLAFWGTIAIAAQPAKDPQKDKDLSNAQDRMEDRSGNASVLIGTGVSEDHESDTRPQGKKLHKDFSDMDVKKKK